MGNLLAMARAAAWARTAGRVGLAGALLLTVCACTSARIGGSEGPDKALNELRESNHKLQAQVSQLQTHLDQRDAQVKVLNQQIDGARPMPGVEAPKAVTVELGSFSSAIDTNHDGHVDTLRLYVQPRDQAGRFIPVAGKLAVQAVAIELGQQPVVVAQRDYNPQEWDKAYRTGFTGTHYSLELPVTDTAIPKGVKALTVKIHLTDAATGAVLDQQRAITLP